MSDLNITQKVLAKIKEKQLRPEPRWKFLLENYLVWFLGVLSLAVGSLAFAVIIYMFKNNDWDVYEHISHSFWHFILATLPYFWLIFLAIFVLAAYYNFRRTKKGYKYRLSIIILGAIFLSVLLGASLYGLGIGSYVDETLANNIPMYPGLWNQKQRIWLRPQEGLLAGIVISLGEDGNFEIRDLRQEIWSVDSRGAFIRPAAEIRIEHFVRMIGDKQENHLFKAERIMVMPPEGWIRHHLMMNCGQDCPVMKGRSKGGFWPGERIGPSIIE